MRPNLSFRQRLRYKVELPNVRAFSEDHTLNVLLWRAGTVSDRQESPHSYIDRVIWVALVIAIIGIGWLVVSNL